MYKIYNKSEEDRSGIGTVKRRMLPSEQINQNSFVRQFVGAWARQRPLKKKIEMNS
jgi:hypothetical protein